MGRGLSEQQKQILIWIYEEGGSVRRSFLPQLHERPELLRRPGAKYPIQSNVERASVSRAITRLVKRGLLERIEVERSWRERASGLAEVLAPTTKQLSLTPEGSELAKQLSDAKG